jgi:hypothetical protein
VGFSQLFKGTPRAVPDNDTISSLSRNKVYIEGSCAKWNKAFTVRSKRGGLIRDLRKIQGFFCKMTNRWKGNTDDDVSSSEGATDAQIAVVPRIGMSFSYLRCPGLRICSARQSE